MLYVRSLSAEERAELERLWRQAVGRVSQRAQWHPTSLPLVGKRPRRGLKGERASGVGEGGG